MLELNVIRNKLNGLLDENQQVSEIEKLERHEFVIDVPKQDKFVAEGESVCSEIR